MAYSWSPLLRAVMGAGLAAACLVGGCGTDGEPRPGAASPCYGPLAGVLGCPANAQATAGGSSDLDIPHACRKLVSCGVLAGEYLTGSSKACSGDADCGTGECLPNNEGNPVCHYHRLDYQWCVSRMVSGNGQGRCGGGDFQQSEVDAAIACISRTDCAAVGAPFEFKVRSSDHRGDIDKYTCNDGSSKFTATVCDAGLLAY